MDDRAAATNRSIAELGLHGTDTAVAAGLFVLTNNTVIMMIVLLVLGAKILGDGLAGLAS